MLLAHRASGSTRRFASLAPRTRPSSRVSLGFFSFAALAVSLATFIQALNAFWRARWRAPRTSAIRRSAASMTARWISVAVGASLSSAARSFGLPRSHIGSGEYGWPRPWPSPLSWTMRASACQRGSGPSLSSNPPAPKQRLDQALYRVLDRDGVVFARRKTASARCRRERWRSSPARQARGRDP